MKNLYFAGSASANYYDLLYNQVGGSDSDATHIVDRVATAQFPNCIIKTGCWTLFPTQSSGTSMWTNAGYSNFTAAVVVPQAVPSGFSFDVNYTLSHSQDNGIAPEAGSGVGSSIMLNPPTTTPTTVTPIGMPATSQRERARSAALLAGQEVMSTSSDLEGLVGGWQLSGIYHYRSSSVGAYSGIWVTNWSFPDSRFRRAPQHGSPAQRQRLRSSRRRLAPRRTGNRSFLARSDRARSFAWTRTRTWTSRSRSRSACLSRAINGWRFGPRRSTRSTG